MNSHRVAAALALPILLGLMAGSSVGQEDVRFPWQPGRAKQFTLETVNGELTAKLFRPAASAASYVVFLHGCDGLKLNSVSHWADFFTSRGVGVAMVDSFTARGRTGGCGEPEWIPRRADDAASAISWLRAQPFARADRIAVMGQSQGGAAALLVASNRSAAAKHLVGAIAMYPGCPAGAPLQYARPMVVQIGGEDTWTTAAACEKLKSAQEPDSRFELTVYPGTPHGFDNPGPARMGLGNHLIAEHPESRDKARLRVDRFIAEHLK